MSATCSQTNASLTAQIINPLLSAVVDAFEQMLGCEVRRGELTLCPSEERVYGTSALIGVTGKARGCVCISFHKNTALSVYERMLGERVPHLTPGVIDCLGEMANVIGGGAKSKLEMGLNLGLPKVIQRRDHAVDFPPAARPMRLHFGSALGPFCVDFGFVASRA